MPRGALPQLIAHEIAVALFDHIAEMNADAVARVAAAEAATTKVLSLAPNHAFAHFVLGSAYICTNRGALGIAECERALALDRSLAAAHAIIGHGKNTVGRAEETEGHIVEALRLSPRDIMAYHSGIGDR